MHDSAKNAKKNDLRQGVPSSSTFKEFIAKSKNKDDVESTENRGSERQNPISDRWLEDDKDYFNTAQDNKKLEGLLT